MTPAQRAVDVGASGNSTATTLTAPPPLWQTPVYETFIVLVAHYRFWNIDDKNLKNEHTAYAYCTRCKRSVRFGKGNSGVERHMSNYHAAALANYGKEDDVDENSLEPQPEVQSRQLREVSPEQQKEVYVLLARWIAAHFCPLLLVEDKGFITFIKFITSASVSISTSTSASASFSTSTSLTISMSTSALASTSRFRVRQQVDVLEHRDVLEQIGFLQRVGSYERVGVHVHVDVLVFTGVGVQAFVCSCKLI
ncbi:hypothetical protein PHYSODRAFT_330687 [Phytophthora sojae]|uniref:BED-type domain-containing protein n=1 Tax=Phytophthora sojae (strain P6497) TaxID=1094619 RepID=G4ZFU0_PHYSP|nr:hypothetical protein PHYSODRAFT_330687 [Phytophthora sojae]EGZ16624.1 hypothetical protein PHYSODRAFT_330687 [Phytophthora sojae]|eukprot:XP_009525682.1 hypothetical protein PHYSODRAFT_330687 [Phytophthora sojae]